MGHNVHIDCKSIDRSIRLRLQRMCEQEHVSLSNAAITHVRLSSVKLLVAHWVVIGQLPMGQSLMDQYVKIRYIVTNYLCCLSMKTWVPELCFKEIECMHVHVNCESKMQVPFSFGI